ncbi:hypothetical protein B9Q01_02360 [Candidatus Marsarchaeota G1 archaeon OSP_D]|jgi:heme/copper-type cytochrome/quinol oxidase subunit 4|uniref:Cytochrome C oxidase subunit IV n=3 Tax=Candidatus Marsarchaeota group 1 TaxID=2203770 RepID=A0A2R6AGP0_9ARCH|nr:MAG: hypothetical protein B9Q01_02360 [Candidatus Marsarchaeota G1 archaeon OSP_D]PSN85509.1 MAG: hypothetical protein B9Q02_06110 [Candidatus Marsarchaeota G1 archaeon BE_D]PSN89028.1 MAG: hypothetical protein B9Q00_02950 [Candidatus Marsarchaeota G1 archaeon OSP_C]
MRKSSLALVIWGYLIFTAILETLLALTQQKIVLALIFALVVSQLTLLARYFMHLDSENRYLRWIFVASLMFALGLLTGVLTSLV